MFQSTHPHGVRPKNYLRLGCIQCFNPRTRTGCDEGVDICWVEEARFNPRTRTGCDITISMRIVSKSCFNPRTRTGCDSAGALAKVIECVSIHAPARGATYGQQARLSRTSSFNPRTRTGCDIQRPAKQCGFYRFNPRTRTGCDSPKIVITTNYTMFQSTHPHGVRHLAHSFIFFQICFNPRTRTGCDAVMREANDYLEVSIHAPARGATAWDLYLQADYVFQSTHPHGVRQFHVLVIKDKGCFNPRTRTGCDWILTVIPALCQVSIHAPARGATFLD